MGVVTSTCPHCNGLVSVETQTGELTELRCAHCGTRQRQAVYPAYLRETEAPERAPLVEEGASCYFHETAGAENLCDDCGRYLCPLCTLAIPMPASEPANFPRQVCPACFAHRIDEESEKGEWDLFQTVYKRHDVAALALTFLPILVLPLLATSLITFPIAIYLALRHWPDCRTPVWHYRRRLVITLAVAGAGAVIWTSILAFNLVNAL